MNRQSTRASLLSEADALLHSNSYSKETSARVEHLMRLADSMSDEHNALRKLRMQEIAEQNVIADPTQARYYRKETRELSSVEQDFDTALRHGRDLVPSERRALSVGTGSAGGWLVPQSFSDRVWASMKQYDAIFDPNVSTVITTETGDSPLPVPVIDDTSGVATKVPENQQVTPSDVASFAQVSLTTPDTWRTNMQQVSFELAQDSAFDLGGVLADLFGVRLARGVGADFVSTLITGSAQGKVGTTGQTTSVTYDDPCDLIGSVDPAYVASPKCGWLMRFSTLVAIMKLKASTAGSPMLNFDAGRWMLFGKPVYVCPSVPAMGANAKSILFGDTSRFIIRRVADGVEVKRFSETYAEYLCFAYQGFMRVKAVMAKVSGSDPVKYYQNSAT